MSDPDGLSALDLDELELEALKPLARLIDQKGRRCPPATVFVEWLLREIETVRPWAELFDRMTVSSPPPPGDRYTAEEFLEWLLLERRSRSREQVTERRRDERQIRQMNRALAS